MLLLCIKNFVKDNISKDLISIMIKYITNERDNDIKIVKYIKEIPYINLTVGERVKENIFGAFLYQEIIIDSSYKI